MGELTPDQKEVIAAQRDDLERLERMMRDLLDVTRLEAGVTPPRFEIVKSDELAASAMQAVDASARKQKAWNLSTIGRNNCLSVRADRNQITRVLVNLLNNAIRHTPTGGSVTVRVYQERDGVVFSGGGHGYGNPRRLPAAYFRAVRAGSRRDAGRSRIGPIHRPNHSQSAQRRN